jgi:uncharacterized iron-regulated membrane protein
VSGRGVRGWILRLHRWSTFAIGAFVVLLCATGAVLMFADEIDRLARPALYEFTPGDVGPDSALTAMRGAVPGRAVTRLWYPRAEQPVYIGEFGGVRFAHVDPGSGRVLGVRGEPVINVIRQLHANLRLGLSGSKFVAWLGILMLGMFATGLVLWWPGLRKLPLGFRLRRRGGATLVNYDLHNLMGVLSTPLLVVITLTGAGIVYSGLTRSALHALWSRSPEPRAHGPRPVLAEPRPGQAMAVGDLVRRARDTLPDFDVMAVVLPQRAGNAVQVRMVVPGGRLRDGNARVMLDPADGSVVGTIDPRAMNAPDAFQARWVFALHAGEFGGLPVQLLYTVVGMVPVALTGTGLAVWWLRRKGRLALAERRAARAA